LTGAVSSASYGTLLRAPGALAFTASAAVGRMPLSMVTLGALLLVEDQTGSYALAGAVSACLALGEAAFGPAVSRLVDRFGQATVVPVALVVHALAMAALVALALTDSWAPLLLVAALVCGGGLPPIGSCVRARWSFTLTRAGREDDIPTAMAWEAVVDEVVFVLGPVLVIGISSVVDPVAGLSLALVFAVAGGLSLAVQRATQPLVGLAGGHHGSALRFAGLRTLALMAVGVGAMFGASEVAMIAFADGHGAKGSSGVLLGLLALGSGISGLAYGTRDWRWSLDRRLLLGASVLVLGTCPLLLAPSLGVMAALAFVAGLAVSPTMIASFGLVERLMPASVLTESFTWLTSGIGIGAAVGSALAGLVADHAEPRYSFAVCTGGALVALAVAAALRATLRPPVRLVAQ
jgi:MFS family permease